jgi:hypothetical protein
MKQITAMYLGRKIIVTSFFKEKRQVFCRKVANIAKTIDHNIEPRYKFVISLKVQ